MFVPSDRATFRANFCGCFEWGRDREARIIRVSGPRLIVVTNARLFREPIGTPEREERLLVRNLRGIPIPNGTLGSTP
jgi:hypothetical protein